MLRFFRKMRNALIPESHFGRYFFYALGEIVLVVIGILIALQVNNWNGERKLKQTEKILLSAMVSELKTDSSTISFNIKIHEQAKKSCNIILNAIEKDLEYTDSLAYHSGAVNYYTRFASSESAYESLKTVGLEAISNNSLRFKIIQYYETSNVIHNTNLDLYTEYIFNLQKDFYPGLFNQFKVFDSDKIYNGEMMPLDFEQLKQNPNYKYHIKTLRNNHIIINDLLNKKKSSEIESLINSCLKEIENLE